MADESGISDIDELDLVGAQRLGGNRSMGTLPSQWESITHAKKHSRFNVDCQYAEHKNLVNNF
jgi:hypothetical protein